MVLSARGSDDTMRLRRTELARQPGSVAVSFSFGKNWQRFVTELQPKAIEAMAGYFERWLPEPIRDRSFLDIGSGSGLSSLVAYQHGARVTSFDIDPRSVDATARLRSLAGSPGAWRVLSGSILDETFLESIGLFDVAPRGACCTIRAIFGRRSATQPPASFLADYCGSPSTGKDLRASGVSD